VGCLENAAIRLEYLAEAGPRIFSLQVRGSEENLLGEVPAARFDTPSGVFTLYGGHRLWHSPEAFPRTYVPDDAPPEIETIAEGVRLIQPVEAATGIQKIMEIRLPGQESAVIVDHTLVNAGPWPVELAPWAITLFPLGGVAILPVQPVNVQKDALLPDRPFVLWPYTDIRDARLELNNDLILIRGEAKAPAVKIGYLNRRGWAGYYRGGVFFRKCFDPLVSQSHPDYGCNTECYCKDLFLELETLGPLTRLEPGGSISHSERWDIFSGISYPQTLEGIREMVNALQLD